MQGNIGRALEEATNRSIITLQQARDLLPILSSHLEAQEASRSLFSTPIDDVIKTLQESLTLLNVLYYSGGLVVATGMVVFLTMGLNRWLVHLAMHLKMSRNGLGIFACATAYSIAFGILGGKLAEAPNSEGNNNLKVSH